ncbi:uncharacterized protein LOC121875743 isoform X2 [Homarus americanus]|uniref:uncharacterized protein LOC121875743 isoform X2 n=1 Tax=Homarus americanus TaxID=6706 RepID=UPI001C44E4F8|nr:uncharacterized protein LOC121875743 isoform X2 [Homarus americanus]
MGKCCSKPQEEDKIEGETQEILLEIDPEDNMTGGTLVVKSPGRWGVTPRGTSPTKKPTIVTTPGVRSTRTVTITKGAGGSANKGTTVVTKPITSSPGNRATKTVTITKGPGVTNSSGATVTNTFHFSSGGTTTESVSYNVPGGQGNTRFVTNKQGYVSGAMRHTATSNVFTTTNNLNNVKARNAFFNITPSPSNQSMGKTRTETTTRTFTKDGKRYEETVEVVTKEDDAGNVTKTTKTVTKALDSYCTREMAAALDDSTTRRSRPKSSSSSSDSSPDRARTSKVKTKSGTKSSKGGLLSKLKGDKPDGSDSSDEEEFVKGVHKGVNEHRAKHGVSKLKLNKEMNKYAKEWAKKLAVNEKMSNNPDSKYGENLYSVTSNTNNFKVKSDEVVDKWYGEHKEHKFGEEPKGTLLKSGHFSQMVWKDTKQMGVGKARNAAGTKVFVVANFDPQGNWMGQFADQVPPVGGFPKSATSGRTSLFSSKTKKSSTSDSDSSSDEDDFAKDCLKAHNDLRKKHGAPPLKLSKKLSKYAQEWATTIAKKDVLQHRQNNSYGENLYCAWSSNPNHKIKGHEAVDSWYEEIKDFTFGREPSDLRAGHFTQVVWEDSKELGVATARNKSGKIYVVANYSPAGNFVGSFATKVPRLK